MHPCILHVQSITQHRCALHIYSGRKLFLLVLPSQAQLAPCNYRTAALSGFNMSQGAASALRLLPHVLKHALTRKFPSLFY